MSWIISESVNVINDQRTVAVTGNVDLSGVKEGWSVQIGTNPHVEALSGTAPDSSGNSTLTLKRNWPFGNASGAYLSIIPHNGYQVTLGNRIQALIDNLVQVKQLQSDYVTALGQITATDPDTNQQHVYNTLRQNQQEMDDLLGSLGTAAGYDVTSSSTDTSSGVNGLTRLLRAGDFGGYGGDSVPSMSNLGVSSLNDIHISSILAAGVGNSDLPTETSVTVNTILRNADHGMQDVFTSDGQTRRYFRIKDGGTWLPYVEALHTGNTGSIVTKNYIEGTFSPSVEDTDGVGVASYSSRIGEYTRKGDEVTAYILMGGSWVTTPSATGRLRIGNLPFISSGDYSFMPNIGFTDPTSAGGGVVAGYIVNNSNYCVISASSGISINGEPLLFDDVTASSTDFYVFTTITYKAVP